MPTYQYACTDCGEQLEVVQKFTDDALTVCPACEGKLRKVFSAVGVVFKGSGFYRNDSRTSSNSTDESSSSSGDSSSAADSNGKSDSSSPKDSASKDSASKDSSPKESSNGSTSSAKKEPSSAPAAK